MVGRKGGRISPFLRYSNGFVFGASQLASWVRSILWNELPRRLIFTNALIFLDHLASFGNIAPILERRTGLFSRFSHAARRFGGAINTAESS